MKKIILFILISFSKEFFSQEVKSLNKKHFFKIDTSSECIVRYRYENKQKNGWTIISDLKGKVSLKLYFVDDKVTKIISYYENTNQISEVKEWKRNSDFLSKYNCLSYDYHEYGERSGEWISYYRNGKIKESGRYVRSKKTGIWNYYYFNGKVKLRNNYTTKSVHYFDSLGRPKIESFYKKLT